ncbi:type II secretion system protein GspK [uncultured Thiocystis sp.]|jgi:general secretion pathway protein K|uniref:general secretion pathway protein GspK n=1 Tax=uncultured Thiocystis sp. TaxID=1202134 RepID=UPI0025D42328|nr:type II secretion system protein GspK [uncultured Thiocystis sp.]
MTHPTRQRGIALMLVMWVLTLLTVMAVSMTAAQRTEIALTDNHVAETRFRVMSDAAIAYTALQFMSLDSAPDEPPPLEDDEEAQTSVWRPNGSPRIWHFAGAEMTIAVFNELSRINLNQAEPALLATLLKVLQAPEDQAEPLAAAIVDWRDEDDLVQLNGAEDDDYQNAGIAFGAKDEPFIVVEELRQVLGMTQDIYRRLAPEVTLEGEGEDLVVEFASPAVLAATQGLSLEDAQLQIAERDLTTVPGAREPLTLDRGGPIYRIQVTEQLSGRQGRRMEALMELMPGQQPPYLVHWRRFGLDSEAPSNPSLESESG